MLYLKREFCIKITQKRGVCIKKEEFCIKNDELGQDGTGSLTMFFRVNGAAVYARGGNKIPMELLDGRSYSGEYVCITKARICT